jgi:hypothetical protein
MFFWGEEKRRRPFGIVTKRIEWLKAAGDSGKTILLQYLADGEVPTRMPRSKCRKCKKSLTWGSGTYDFDHWDNNSSNNSQKNCRLVCKNCHGGATKTKKIAERNPYTGEVTGYRTIKLKVGYKKTARKSAGKPAKKTVRKPARKTAKKPTSKTARTKR